MAAIDLGPGPLDVAASTRGIPIDLQLAAYNDDGTAIVLTGYTFKAQLRAARSTGAPLIEFTFNTSNVASGVFRVLADAAQMDQVAGEYVWGGQATKSGAPTYQWAGTWRVNDSVVI